MKWSAPPGTVISTAALTGDEKENVAYYNDDITTISICIIYMYTNYTSVIWELNAEC